MSSLGSAMSEKRDDNYADDVTIASEVLSTSVTVAAYEFPAVYDYLGKNRYLQAAFCKSVAKLYSDKFGPSTTKALSNIAAEEGNIGMLEWSKEIGCRWVEGVFVSGAKCGSVDVLRWLVNSGCPMPDDNAAWEAAAERGHLEVLKFAYESKYLHSYRFLPLCEVAAETGHLNVLKWVHEVDSSDYFDARTCQLAASGGFIDMLRWLRSVGCEWNERVCWWAIHEGKLDTLKWLISNGCPLNVNGSPFDTSVLWLAASEERVDIMKFLIHECGADVNYAPTHAPPSPCPSPLFIAVHNGNLEAVKLLLDSGADASTKNIYGRTLLSIALARGRNEIFLQVLREAGAR